MLCVKRIFPHYQVQLMFYLFNFFICVLEGLDLEGPLRLKIYFAHTRKLELVKMGLT